MPFVTSVAFMSLLHWSLVPMSSFELFTIGYLAGRALAAGAFDLAGQRHQSQPGLRGLQLRWTCAAAARGAGRVGAGRSDRTDVFFGRELWGPLMNAECLFRERERQRERERERQRENGRERESMFSIFLLLGLFVSKKVTQMGVLVQSKLKQLLWRYARHKHKCSGIKTIYVSKCTHALPR